MHSRKLVLFYMVCRFTVFSCASSSPHEDNEENTFCQENADGRYPDPYNCCKFIHCSNGVLKQRFCPLGLMFNRTLKVCDWAEHVCCEAQIPENPDGDWINGVYTGCRFLKTINKITEKFPQEKNASEVMAELSNITAPQHNTTLSETVLMTSLHSLVRLVEFQAAKGNNSASKMNFTIVCEIASNLLDSANNATWVEIDSKTRPNIVVSQLIKTLDDYGLHIASETERDITILTKNLAATIVKPNRNIKELKKESCFVHQHSSVCLPAGIFPDPSFSGAVSIIYYTLNQVLLLEACALGITYTTDMRRNDSLTPCDRLPIQSVIVSSTIGRSGQLTLNASVKVVLQNRYNPSAHLKRMCVFWEYEDPLNAWSSRGCHAIPEESTNEVTTCRCTHFTLFAVLLDPYNVKVSGSHQQALELISTAGCSVSLGALTCTILITVIFWRKLESVRTKVLLHLCFFLAGSCLLVIIADRAQESETYCKLVAVSLHFMLLSAFCWMLCEGILLYCITTVVAANHEDKIKYFYLLGWGVPSVIAMVTLAVSGGKGYGRDSSKSRTCWLTVESGLIWLFVAPASFVLLINMILLIIVVRKALSTHVMLTRTQLQKVRAGIKATIVSLPLLGITWTFGLLAFNSDTIFFKYIFAVSNSLQGLMIFVFHCVLNKQLHAIQIPNERCSSIYESYQGNFIEDMMKKGLEWSSLTQQENRLVDALAL